jgi:hypothetical protein
MRTSISHEHWGAAHGRSRPPVPLPQRARQVFCRDRLPDGKASEHRVWRRFARLIYRSMRTTRRGETSSPVEDACGDDARLRYECVTGDQRMVTNVKIGEVPRRMTGTADGAQAAYLLAVHQCSCRPGMSGRETEKFFALLSRIERKIATKQTRLPFANRYLDPRKCVRQFILCEET